MAEAKIQKNNATLRGHSITTKQEEGGGDGV